jgi:hypothetical protein
MKTPTVLRSAADLRPANELRDVRRADLLFAFGDENEIDRQLFPSSLDGVKCRQHRGFGPLLVHRSAADDRLSHPRLVVDPRFERRRGPLRRVELLDVVHEVQPDRLRSTGVERREHARLAVGLDHGRLLKAGVLGELRHALRPIRVAAVLGRDRRCRDPVLEPLHRFVVPLHDLLTDRAQICIGRVGRAGDKDAGARNDRSRNRRFQDRCHRGTPSESRAAS